MSIQKTTNKDEIPKGATLMTAEEVIQYQFDIIRKWDSIWEVLPLRAGAGFLGITSMLTSLYINNFIRRKLKLKNFNTLASYIPTVALPALITVGLHTVFVVCGIFLQEDSCPVCLQARAMAIQVGCGVVYPSVLAPVSGFMLATRNFTYRLPDVKENPKEAFRLAGKFLGQIRQPLVGFFALNAFIAGFVTYKEVENFYTINEKLAAMENDPELLREDKVFVTKKSKN